MAQPLFRLLMSSLTDMYNIRHICILPYNSQANGVVEQCHLDVQEAIIKSTLGGGILLAYRRSLSLLGQVRDCALVHRFVAILYGSWCQAILYGSQCRAIFPFDLTEATFLVPPPDTKPLSSSGLITWRARQLQSVRRTWSQSISIS